MLPKKGTPTAEALERAEEASSTVVLPAEQLQRLRLAQSINAGLFQRQKSRVGPALARNAFHAIDVIVRSELS